MFKYKLLLLTLTLSTIFGMQSIAKDFFITNGNVYGSGGLVEAIKSARENNDAVNTIHLANGGTYVLDRIIEQALSDRGPCGLPIWRSKSSLDKKLIIKGNGSTVRRSSSAPVFRFLYAYNHSDISVENATFTNFRTGTHGGGVFYMAFDIVGTFKNCKFPNNQTTNINARYGGSIYMGINGHLILDNCEFTDNRCWGEGGAVYVVLSDFTCTNSTFLRNKAINTNTSVEGIINAGAVQVDGASRDDDEAGKIIVRNSIFDSNESGSFGKEKTGGACYLFLYDSQDMEVDKCTFKNNKSGTFGGGLSVSSNQGNSGSEIKITNSAFYNNTTGSQGGAIFMISKIGELTNCTVSNNTSGAWGGGLVIYPQGNTVVKHCTIDNNDAKQGGGGIFCTDESLKLYNSIVAFNTVNGKNDVAANCRLTYQGTGNLEYPQKISHVNARSCTNNVMIGDPKLGNITNNGGPTNTKALGSNSPAINKASSSFTTSTDQRGVSRSGSSDIGAFEYNSGSTPPPNPTADPVTITKIVLVNTSGTPIAGHDPLVNGAQVNLSNIDATKLSIQAITSATPSRVEFSLSGASSWSQTERVAPYTLFGDQPSGPFAWKPAAPKAGDNYSLTVTPYNADGTVGAPTTISFSYVENSNPPPTNGPTVTSIALINTNTDQPVPGYENLQNGAQIKLSDITSNQISIRVNAANTGSVDMKVSGADTWTKLENIEPYALFGDQNGQFTPWALKTPANGDAYKLIVTPYKSGCKRWYTRNSC